MFVEGLSHEQDSDKAQFGRGTSQAAAGARKEGSHEKILKIKKKIGANIRDRIGKIGGRLYIYK